MVVNKYVSEVRYVNNFQRNLVTLLWLNLHHRWQNAFRSVGANFENLNEWVKIYLICKYWSTWFWIKSRMMRIKCVDYVCQQFSTWQFKFLSSIPVFRLFFFFHSYLHTYFIRVIKLFNSSNCFQNQFQKLKSPRRWPKI